MVKVLATLKKYLHFYDKSLLRRLNLIGLVGFSILVILLLIVYPTRFSQNQRDTLFFIIIYNLSTANINDVIFPYGYRKPATLFISSKLILRHVLRSVLFTHSPQLLIASMLMLFSAMSYQLVVIIMLAYCIFITLLANLLSGIFLLLFQFGIFAVIFSVYHSNWHLSIFSLFLMTLLIMIVVLSKFEKGFLVNLLFKHPFDYEKKLKPRNLITLMTKLLRMHIWVGLTIGILFMILAYFMQPFAEKTAGGVPMMFLFQAFYLPMFEIMIGNSIEEMEIDRSRLKLFYSNNYISNWKKFQGSTLFLVSCILLFIEIFGLFGIFLYRPDIRLILKNLLFVPFPLFLGFVYFRKSEMLVSDECSRIMRFSLPLLFTILITVAFIGRGQ